MATTTTMTRRTTMSDRRPPAFSLVSALADRLFIDSGVHSEHRRRERPDAFTPLSSAGAASATVTTGTGRYS
jgi:hypothetical protein